MVGTEHYDGKAKTLEGMRHEVNKTPRNEELAERGLDRELCKHGSVAANPV